MSETPEVHDVIVIGGGPAGSTVALYTTRLGLDTALIDRGGGRAAMMQETHNVIGVTEEVSGGEFLQTAREQVASYGADVVRGFVESVERVDDDLFALETDDGDYRARRVVLATGFSDVRPDPPLPPTGRGLHYCLHCDAYMFVDEPVYVMGTGDSAAFVAMIMLNFTDEVDVLTRGEEIEWSEETDRRLRGHPIDVIETEITGVSRDDGGWLESFEFADGEVREYTGGFPMYGSDYNADLADQLGLERTEGGAVEVDDHGATSVDGVYAVGDLTPGHNQVPVAMGEGAKAGIQIHYDLREFPKRIEELEADGPVGPDDVPAISPELLATAVTHEGHAPRPREDAAVTGTGEDATED